MQLTTTTACLALAASASAHGLSNFLKVNVTNPALVNLTAPLPYWKVNVERTWGVNFWREFVAVSLISPDYPLPGKPASCDFIDNRGNQTDVRTCSPGLSYTLQQGTWTPNITIQQWAALPSPGGDFFGTTIAHLKEDPQNNRTFADFEVPLRLPVGAVTKLH